MRTIRILLALLAGVVAVLAMVVGVGHPAHHRSTRTRPRAWTRTGRATIQLEPGVDASRG